MPCRGEGSPGYPDSFAVKENGVVEVMFQVQGDMMGDQKEAFDGVSHGGTSLAQANEPVMLKWKVSHAVRADIFDGSKKATYPVGLQGEIFVHPDKTRCVLPLCL
jgi:hypothetical protein